MSTASTILSLAFHQLRAEQGTTDVPGLSTEDMLSVLNTVNQEWQSVFQLTASEPLLTRKSEYGIDLVVSTALAADVASGASSLTVGDGTKLDSVGGAAVIWDNDVPDIFEYGAPSGNSIPSVSGIDWAHETDDRVQQIYALPSNFDSFRSEDSNPDGVMWDNRIPLRYTSSPPVAMEYSLHDNGTTKYLWLPIDMTGSIRVTYNKSTTVIDDVSDEIDIPSKYDWFAVYRLIAHGKRSRGDLVTKVRYPNGEVVDEDDHKADQVLLRAQKERNIRKSPRVRPITNRRHSGLYRSNFREG